MKQQENDLILWKPDYTKIKKCRECVFSDGKGICKFFTLYSHLHNGCLKEPSQAAERDTMKIENLELSTRAYNSLKRQEIDTTEKLQATSDEQLRLVRNLGEKCFKEVKEKLSIYQDSIKVYEIADCDIAIAKSEEELKNWYEANYDSLDEGDIEELNADTQGMWYPTEDPEDFGRATDCVHTPTKFGDLIWYEGDLQKFTPYREVLKLLGEYTGPSLIASSEW
jgi:hypothetical protein